MFMTENHVFFDANGTERHLYIDAVFVDAYNQKKSVY